MATSISSISAELNALAQAGVVSENATEVIATIPAGTASVTVSFDKDKDYTLQQIHTEVLLAVQKAVKASSTTPAAEPSAPVSAPVKEEPAK